MIFSLNLTFFHSKLSYLVFCYFVSKTLSRISLGWKKLSFFLPITIYFLGNPRKWSRPELEERIEAERCIEKHYLLTCFPCTWSESFLIKHRTTCSELTPPTEGWVFLPKSVIKLHVTDMATCQSYRDNSSAKISQTTLDCVKLTKIVKSNDGHSWSHAFQKY